MSLRTHGKTQNLGAVSIEYILISVLTGTVMIAACKNLGFGLKDNVKKIGDTIEQSETRSEQATKGTH